MQDPSKGDGLVTILNQLPLPLVPDVKQLLTGGCANQPWVDQPRETHTCTDHLTFACLMVRGAYCAARSIPVLQASRGMQVEQDTSKQQQQQQQHNSITCSPSVVQILGVVNPKGETLGPVESHVVALCWPCIGCP